METLLLIAGSISIAVCMYASVLVLRNTTYDWRLKLMQLAIVWFVPFVGGYLVAYVSRRAVLRQEPHPSSTGVRTGYTQHDAPFAAPQPAADTNGDAGRQ